MIGEDNILLIQFNFNSQFRKNNPEKVDQCEFIMLPGPLQPMVGIIE